MGTASGAVNIGSLFIDIGADTRGLLVAGAAMDKLGARAGRLGGRLTRVLTLPLAAISGLSIKSAIDFESSFTGIRKTVDATEAQFAQLSSEIRGIARSIPVGVNALNAIGESAGQLGIKTENISGFIKVMADLGVTTNLSADQAATSLARFVNITGASQDTFSNLGSTIVGLGNNLATTEAEIVTFGLRIAGAGAQVGITDAKILGFGAALSSVGISAEAGGTALSRVFVEIDKSVAKGDANLVTFARVAGKSTKDFAKAFKKDAAGAVVDFIEGLGALQDRGQNVNLILEKMGLDNIRVADALKRTANAGDLVRRALSLADTEFEKNTALADEAAKRYGTVASQAKILGNQIVDLAIDLGQTMIPAVRGMIKLVSGAVGFVRNLSPETKKWGLAVLFTTAAIGPAILVTERLFSVMKLMLGVLPRLTIKMLELAGSMFAFAVANPKVILALLAVGTAASATAFVFRDEIIKWVQDAKQAFLDLAKGIGASSSEMERQAGKFDLPEFGTDPFVNFPKQVSVLQRALDSMKASLKVGETEWETFADTVDANVREFGASLIDGEVNFKSFIASILKSLAEAELEPLFQAFAGFIKTLIGGLFGPADPSAGVDFGGGDGSTLTVENLPGQPGPFAGDLTVIPDPVVASAVARMADIAAVAAVAPVAPTAEIAPAVLPSIAPVAAVASIAPIARIAPVAQIPSPLVDLESKQLIPTFDTLVDAITVLTDKLSTPSLLIAPSLPAATADFLAQAKEIGAPIVNALDRLGQSPAVSFDGAGATRDAPTTIVNVINKAPDSKVETRRRPLPGGGESFDVIISSVVSRDIAQGGQVAKSISAVFGSRRLGAVG